MTKLLGICVEPASTNGNAQIFGIADFLATVAIFVVAYSLSDAKYKFRSAVSSVPYRLVLFYATVAGGIGLLLSNLWFAVELPIPRAINDPFIFQITIAALLISVLCIWMSRSFVYPPRFSKRNAIPFATEVFHGIADGDEAQLHACAYEVGRSVETLVREASRREVRRALMKGGFEHHIPETAHVASDILSLIGDRRFCRLVARRMPWVAAEIFRTAAQDAIDVRPLAQFSRNVSAEFFADVESAIHHEDDEFYSGLIGHLKPVSSAMFGNSVLIEKLSHVGGSPLQLLFMGHGEWTLTSWKTYHKAVLLYLGDRLKRDRSTYVSTAMYQIFSGYRHLGNDIRSVNDMSDAAYVQSLPYRKFNELVSFVRDAVELLNQHQVVADRFPSKHNGRFSPVDIYDHLSKIALDLFACAGAVNAPDFRSWTIHYNTLWYELLSEFNHTNAQNIFRKRLQRVIWDKVSDMSRIPDYQGAQILCVCLNVLGFRMDHKVYSPDGTMALKRLITRWARENFLTLYADYPVVAESCIGGTITFDKVENRLVKTYSAMFGTEPAREYLDLDPPRVKSPSNRRDA
ncbi:hypothetical protein [Agrobacterium rosae]|uniref:hypothetical protein n=1 Tax=Agrobacterium rosae TaxID=1972867 RepID=UPI0011B46513|nr:hypothetical protein [Agrobacterium rosae]